MFVQKYRIVSLSSNVQQQQYMAIFVTTVASLLILPISNFILD